MSEIKFDHSKKDLFDVIGLGDQGKENLCEKQATIAVKIVTGKITIGQIAEEIANTFSYAELIAAATNELVTKTASSMSKHPGMLLQALLSSIKEKE